jgi:signal transduction histidine kinase
MTARRTIAIAAIVVSTLLTNVTKYAHATHATVRVGLRALTDRVAALRRTLEVSTRPRHGTRLQAPLYCM